MLELVTQATLEPKRAGGRWALVVALALLLCGVGAARATTFLYSGDDALAMQSDAVVVGTVKRSRAMEGRNGGVVTNVELRVDRVVAGVVDDASIQLSEMGGDLEGRSERIFGAPRYRVGEKVLAFVQRRPGGGWQTAAMALGKYELQPSTSGWRARRDLEGAALWDARKRKFHARPAPMERDLAEIVSQVREVFARRGLPLGSAEIPEADELVETQAPFTLLGPARWFQPDQGLPVQFFLATGAQVPLDEPATHLAVKQAMQSWSSVPNSFLRIEAAGVTDPIPFAGCPERSVLTFNDPFQEVSNPQGCSGVLALGGFCVSGAAVARDGLMFAPIAVGKVVFNDGFEQCGIWDPCNLAEVATHELGHAIGLGHSTDRDATMAPVAHFDGRCSALDSDDMAGLRFLYGEPMPDLVVLPRTPVTIRIPPGVAELTKSVPVYVRNARPAMGFGSASAAVEVIARDGDCPAGTVGLPDLDPKLAGTQGTRSLARGEKQPVWVPVVVRAADVFTPGSQSVFRCTAWVEVRSADGETADRSEQNNRIPLVINVVDGNDMATLARTQQIRETVLSSLNPVRVVLPRTMPVKIKDVRLRIRNADVGTFPNHVVEVRVDPGDCPSGTVAGWDFSPAAGDQHIVDVPQNGSVRGTLTLIPPPGGFYSSGPQSPSRCTLQVSVTPLDGEMNLGNNSAPLVLDVVDYGDF